MHTNKVVNLLSGNGSHDISTADTNVNENESSTDHLFDSITSEDLNEVLEKEDKLGPLGKSPSNGFGELTKEELLSLNDFNPMSEAWNDRGNKINKQRTDLTMPADNIVCKVFCLQFKILSVQFIE